MHTDDMRQMFSKNFFWKKCPFLDIAANRLAMRNCGSLSLLIFSTSARRDVLLSAISRLLLPALDFGTAYLLTSGLPRHSKLFVGS